LRSSRPTNAGPFGASADPSTTRRTETTRRGRSRALHDGGQVSGFPGIAHKSLILMVGFAAILLQSSLASAASLRTEVAARKVGVGQSFEVQVTAVQDDGDPAPQSPRLKVQGSARVSGPSIGSQRRMTMKNFNFHSETSVIATWTVTPLKTGKVVVGPGSFQVGSERIQGEQIIVEV